MKYIFTILVFLIFALPSHSQLPAEPEPDKATKPLPNLLGHRFNDLSYQPAAGVSTFTLAGVYFQGSSSLDITSGSTLASIKSDSASTSFASSIAYGINDRVSLRASGSYLLSSLNEGKTSLNNDFTVETSGFQNFSLSLDYILYRTSDSLLQFEMSLSPIAIEQTTRTGSTSNKTIESAGDGTRSGSIDLTYLKELGQHQLAVSVELGSSEEGETYNEDTLTTTTTSGSDSSDVSISYYYKLQKLTLGTALATQTTRSFGTTYSSSNITGSIIYMIRPAHFLGGIYSTNLANNLGSREYSGTVSHNIFGIVYGTEF